ncbi:hypothetical protein Adt_45255 [Abeliophyllum distichum]|uniref:Uncharacterized protein n=1 Tax=Abeliophyllum distichum TaxID=126358 RepID=A0ABD1PD64_9LAMI
MTTVGASSKETPAVITANQVGERLLSQSPQIFSFAFRLPPRLSAFRYPLQRGPRADRDISLLLLSQRLLIPRQQVFDNQARGRILSLFPSSLHTYLIYGFLLSAIFGRTWIKLP